MTPRRLSLRLLPLLPAALLGALLCLLVPACGGDAGRGDGRLSASVEFLDFGSVPHGEEPVRTLKVRNGGARSVMLKATVPSCACLIVDSAFRHSLMPGEETEIRVTLASGIVPPQKLERKYLEIRSDDPAMAVLMVPVRGEIEERVRVEPVIVRVGPEDAAGRGAPKRITIRAAQGFTARIDKVEITQPEWFEVELVKAEGGVDALLKVKPDPARRGGVNSMVTFRIQVEGRGLAPQQYARHVSIQGTW